MIKLKYSHIKGISESDINELKPLLEVADSKIRNKNGEGAEFTGWIDLPLNYDKEEFARIKKAATRIRENSDVLLVIGIGGSYLGARAVIEFLYSSYYNQIKKDCPEIYFIGNSFSGDELTQVLSLCEGKRVSVNVVSKSGTTTESAVAFRFVRSYLESRYTKEELKQRIFATTDKISGALKAFANKEGYECFVIPDDIGGRFSVLTAVGLLPIAVSGTNIDLFMAGAVACREKLFSDGIDNDAYKYALIRNAFLRKGRNVEVLASYEPSFRFMGEWFKQLFGESEGKDKKGIFPASVIFSTDLHSLGQYMQDGSPILFETVCRQAVPSEKIIVPVDNENIDKLNFLASEEMNVINDKAFLGTLLAHSDGGTDTLIVEYSEKNEFSLGELIYFFFISCAASGYILGVNPFDQPGVEAYKKNMFTLLGKPGSEEKKAELEAKLKIIKM
ncbi:MAG: glucose-6-phosphate isomerase [Clostridiales bacterium GWF2_36_10]|nr:MAG: glucose-6-phosphate isomerase [Clostridiales bacterium GWF2_36_10]HAN22125.1 glucose-6-phosphate isomerase [Clostridiales bacterium]